ncbi:MAG TPA: hypothetical protein VH280_12615 [Verrucomicrobiae bacterium]|jgi:hypothetical protein|nr:hypothetical protein [Verrucomicrobiae bacterium]
MNSTQAKQILIIYRPGMTDADDPEIAEALSMVRNDPGLSHWFDQHCARQIALREKIRQIAPPAGLREQIISEYAARTKAALRREKILAVGCVVAILLSFAVLASVYLPRNHVAPPLPNTLANYQNQMIGAAVSGYYMTAMTNLDQVHSWLAQNHAPSDYVLPVGLKKAAVTGCTFQNWKDAKASMICFRQGKTLPQGQPGDLWLLVIDQTAVKDPPADAPPRVATIDGLATATWTQNGKLYFLAARGDEQTIQKYL